MADLLLFKIFVEIIFLVLFSFIILYFVVNLLRGVVFFDNIIHGIIFALLLLISLSSIFSGIFYLLKVNVMYSQSLIRVSAGLRVLTIISLLIYWIYISDFSRKQLYYLLCGVGGLLLFMLAAADSVQLVSKEEFIGYITNSTMFFMIQYLWIIAWGLVAMRSFINRKTDLSEPSKLQAVAAVTACISELFIYINSYWGNSYIYFIFWALSLVSFVIYFIALQYKYNDQNFFNPFIYVRQRVLFKLVLVMTAMVILSVQGVDLIMTSVNREALMENTVKALEQVISKVEYEAKNLDSDEFQSYIENMVFEDKSYLFVTDSNFNILFHPDRTKIGEKIEGVQSWFVKKRYKIIKNSVGERNLQYYKDSSLNNYKFFIVQPLTMTLRSIYDARIKSMIFVGLLVIVVMLVGAYFAGSIIKPLKKLLMGIYELENDNLSYKVDIQNIDEFRSIGDAYNHMVAALKDARAKLVSVERKLLFSQMIISFKHEINNPLASILTASQIIGQGKVRPDEMKEIVDIIYSESVKINKLIESLDANAPIELVKYGDTENMVHINKEVDYQSPNP